MSHSDRQNSPMSTFAEPPASDPPKGEDALSPRTECVDYSDGIECGRDTCCGMPLVDGFSTHTMLSQHDPVQAALWDDIQGGKALCWLANPYSFTEENAYILLRDALTEILPIDSRFRLYPPVTSPLVKRARAVAFLVWNTSDKEETLLTGREVWSVRKPRDAAFFVEEYNGPPSPFVYTARGFSNWNVFGHDGVDSVFRETVRWNPAVIEFVSRFYDALPDVTHTSPDYLLASCRVELLTTKDDEGDDAVVWNISLESPTKRPALHAVWRKIIASLPLISLAYGTATAIESALLCALCLGTSHQTEQCPWPKLRGWAGPSAEETIVSISLPEDRAERHVAGSGEALTQGEDIDSDAMSDA